MTWGQRWGCGVCSREMSRMASKPPDADAVRGLEQTLPRGLQAGPTLPTPGSQTPGLNWERMKFCCFEPPDLWWVFLATLFSSYPIHMCAGGKCREGLHFRPNSWLSLMSWEVRGELRPRLDSFSFRRSFCCLTTQRMCWANPGPWILGQSGWMEL